MEILGIIATIIVLVSFLMKGEENIRMINIIGAICFVVYGLSIKAFSVWLLNGTLVLIHTYKLINKN